MRILSPNKFSKILNFDLVLNIWYWNWSFFATELYPLVNKRIRWSKKPIIRVKTTLSIRVKTTESIVNSVKISVQICISIILPVQLNTFCILVSFPPFTHSAEHEYVSVQWSPNFWQLQTEVEHPFFHLQHTSSRIASWQALV